MGYPGSKASSTAYPHIIRHIPPHDTYVACFAGHDAIYWKMKPAAAAIVIDADAKVIAWWRERCRPGTIVIHAEARAELQTNPIFRKPTTFAYMDPPYFIETRTRLLYEYELADKDGHLELITIAKSLNCMVAISHYPCPLYDDALTGWHRYTYRTMTHGGPKWEALYMNYPNPQAIHDTRFAGRNFRSRQDIKRKRERWISRLLAMPPLERQAIIEAVTATADAPRQPIHP